MISSSQTSRLFQTPDIANFTLSTSEPLETADSFYLSFGIDDARDLIGRAHHRPFVGARQRLIVRTNFITLEAQNALLKLVEEPPEGTELVFVVPPDFSVIATLQSRLIITSDETGDSKADDSIFTDFLHENYARRFALIESALKQKDLKWPRAMKQGLINYLQNNLKDHSTESVLRLNQVVGLLLTRGASNKLLLEEVALSLPIRPLTKKMLNSFD